MTDQQNAALEPCDCPECGRRPPCPLLDTPKHKMPTHDEWAKNGTDWYLSRVQWRLAEAERLLNTRPAPAGAEAVREALPERPITSLAYSAQLSTDQVRTVQRIVKEMDAYADALERLAKAPSAGEDKIVACAAPPQDESALPEGLGVVLDTMRLALNWAETNGEKPVQMDFKSAETLYTAARLLQHAALAMPQPAPTAEEGKDPVTGALVHDEPAPTAAGCPDCRGETIPDGYNAGRFVHEEGCPKVDAPPSAPTAAEDELREACQECGGRGFGEYLPIEGAVPEGARRFWTCPTCAAALRAKPEASTEKGE